MDLPPAVQRVLEGPIDPYSQHQVQLYSQVFLTVLVIISFAISFLSQSVLLGLEVFGGGFALLVLATVPAWPFLNAYDIKFLPVRKKTQ